MTTTKDETDFWHGRWQAGQIGFHEGAPNEYLVRHGAALDLSKGAGVLVPLSGKSHDMRHLAEAGARVVGCELVEQAVRAFYDEAGVSPAITSTPPFEVFEAPIGAGSVRVLVGDALLLTKAVAGEITRVFDRAALIALPKELRARYVPTVLGLLSSGARILLVTLEHDAGSGPPHSVPRDEVDALYGERCDVTLLERVDVTARSPNVTGKGATSVHEAAYLVTVR